MVERYKPLNGAKVKVERFVPKRGRGRPRGAKDTAFMKLERLRLAVAKGKVLPHEFLLLVIMKGLAGDTLGYTLDAEGNKVPNVVTYDQMVRAAESGLRYFAAPIKVEHTGAGGGPMQVFHIPADRLTNLSTDELRALQGILPKLGSEVKTIEHIPDGDAEAYAQEVGMGEEEEV